MRRTTPSKLPAIARFSNPTTGDNILFNSACSTLCNVRSAVPRSIAQQDAAPRLEAVSAYVRWRPPILAITDLYARGWFFFFIHPSTRSSRASLFYCSLYLSYKEGRVSFCPTLLPLSCTFAHTSRWSPWLRLLTRTTVRSSAASSSPARIWSWNP